ncbi:MAG: hypothetical protein K9M98_15380 [Cephaloticoccus sp.]|nr:hypothetical protein [Cephaloticoccus sp.]MCF7761882.1 hypothetical protein [Cephaloticoccus sp.]
MSPNRRNFPSVCEGVMPTDARSRRLRPKFCHSQNRAFTIVEVAIAVIVLAMALTTGITAMQRAFFEFDTARNLQVAGNILQTEMEKERLLPWAKASDPAYLPVIDTSFNRNPAIAGRFTLSRSLTTLPSRSGQMVQIKLTIRWRSLDGHELSRSYTTYFTQGGLYEYFYNKS